MNTARARSGISPPTAKSRIKAFTQEQRVEVQPILGEPWKEARFLRCRHAEGDRNRGIVYYIVRCDGQVIEVPARRIRESRP